jgi:hypothetical protein
VARVAVAMRVTVKLVAAMKLGVGPGAVAMLAPVKLVAAAVVGVGPALALAGAESRIW